MAEILFQDRDLRGNSTNWANWMSQLGLTTCKYCVKHHGTIVDISVLDDMAEVIAHPNCKCVYVPMRTKLVGTATDMGMEGADWSLFMYQKLPNNYVSKDYAKACGWVRRRGNLDTVLPGYSIGGDEYKNREGNLPSKVGRIWYEADINYDGGYRNYQRVLYSNDGFIFVTYDHYKTFYEITD